MSDFIETTVSFPIKPSSRFTVGEAVEVLDTSRNVWVPARIRAVWQGVHLDDGSRFTQYEVDGKDDISPFYGTWDEDKVRGLDSARPQRSEDGRGSNF